MATQIETSGVLWAWTLIPSLAARPARSTIRENPGADSGAPRSLTNTNAPGAPGEAR
jgi:hypothetical protein